MRCESSFGYFASRCRQTVACFFEVGVGGDVVVRGLVFVAVTVFCPEEGFTVVVVDAGIFNHVVVVERAPLFEDTDAGDELAAEIRMELQDLVFNPGAVYVEFPCDVFEVDRAEVELEFKT